MKRKFAVYLNPGPRFCFRCRYILSVNKKILNCAASIIVYHPFYKYSSRRYTRILVSKFIVNIIARYAGSMFASMFRKCFLCIIVKVSAYFTLNDFLQARLKLEYTRCTWWLGAKLWKGQKVKIVIFAPLKYIKFLRFPKLFFFSKHFCAKCRKPDVSKFKSSSLMVKLFLVIVIWNFQTWHIIVGKLVSDF